MIFNFSGLHGVFKEAIQRHEPTIVFPLSNGRGRFVFLLFIPTNKAGGNHYQKGVFNIAIRYDDEQAFRAELDIENADKGNFSLNGFLDQLNNMIPVSISLESIGSFHYIHIKFSVLRRPE